MQIDSASTRSCSLLYVALAGDIVDDFFMTFRLRFCACCLRSLPRFRRIFAIQNPDWSCSLVSHCHVLKLIVIEKTIGVLNPRIRIPSVFLHEVKECQTGFSWVLKILFCLANPLMANPVGFKLFKHGEVPFYALALPFVVTVIFIVIISIVVCLIAAGFPIGIEVGPCPAVWRIRRNTIGYGFIFSLLILAPPVVVWGAVVWFFASFFPLLCLR